MLRKRTIAATTSALFATTLIVTACSSEEPADDDDDNNGGTSSGTSGTGGKGGTGVSGSSGAGGTPAAGTSGTGTSGGTAGTAAGSAGTAGAGGATGGSAGTAGAGGAAGMMGFACGHAAATCNALTELSADAMCFGSGDFKVGVGMPYGAGLTLDQTMGSLHVSGMVSDYSGFNIWFVSCSDLSAYTGVSFTITGTIAATAPNTIDFQLQTNSTFPWQTEQNMTDMKGGCTATDPTNVWATCIAPKKVVTIPTDATMPVTVLWADMAGGGPVPWDPDASPKEIMGLQWQFPWSGAGDTAYAVDITVDNIKFTGGTAETECPASSCATGTAGAGGAGGGGAGGTAGDGAGGTAGGGSGGGGAGGTAGASGGGTGGGGAGGTAGASGGGSGGGGGKGGGGSGGGGGMSGLGGAGKGGTAG
jgi:hypothetical protein